MKDWTGGLSTQRIHGVKLSARQADDFIRPVPRNVGMAVRPQRTAFALEQKAEVTCPAGIGYHLRTVTETTCEALDRGIELAGITLFQHVGSGKVRTTTRLPFGEDFVAKQKKRQGLRD